MRSLALLICLGAAACSSTAATPESRSAHAAPQCFYASQVSGFSDNGPGRALMNVGARDTWELELSPGCSNVNWAMKIGIVSRGSERICPGRPAELIIPSASGQLSQRCLVRNIRKLSPAETAAARGEKIKD